MKGAGTAVPSSQTERLPTASNQPVCYSATVPHTHRVRSLLTDPIPKFTSFLGSARGNAMGSGRAVGNTAKQPARSPGASGQRGLTGSGAEHVQRLLHGGAMGTAGKRRCEQTPAQGATEQVLLWGSVRRSWQQNPLLAAESMQSLFTGIRWSPSLSQHWRRWRELALVGACRTRRCYCSLRESAGASTDPCMTPGTSLIWESPGIH